MLANMDKFFIMALQEAGYDIDYKKFRDIYSKSREHPGRKARAQFNQQVNDLMFGSAIFGDEDEERGKKV